MTSLAQQMRETRADYEAAEARLREAREFAVGGFSDAQASGDFDRAEAWRSSLAQSIAEFKCFRGGLPEDVRLFLNAERILRSLSVTDGNMVSLVIPADVSDEEAMRALNLLFQHLFSEDAHDIIQREHIETILDAGDGCGRRTSGPRNISVIGVVPHTQGVSREEQSAVLRHQGLVFPHPIEQALAAAAYACAYEGEDLFRQLVVRGSVSRVELWNAASCGVGVDWREDDRAFSMVAASGSPARNRGNVSSLLRR